MMNRPAYCKETVTRKCLACRALIHDLTEEEARNKGLCFCCWLKTPEAMKPHAIVRIQSALEDCI